MYLFIIVICLIQHWKCGILDQFRILPGPYPNWDTCHGQNLTMSPVPIQNVQNSIAQPNKNFNVDSPTNYAFQNKYSLISLLPNENT